MPDKQNVVDKKTVKKDAEQSIDSSDKVGMGKDSPTTAESLEVKGKSAQCQQKMRNPQTEEDEAFFRFPGLRLNQSERYSQDAQDGLSDKVCKYNTYPVFDFLM